MTLKEQNRRYKLHYNLRKKGNKVDARHRTVIRRAKVLTEKEKKWCKELLRIGYAVGNQLFAPPYIKYNRINLMP